MRLFRDRYAERAAEASTRRKVEKMKPPRVTSRHHSPAKPAPAPYTCGRPCDWNGPGTSCASIVRGGHCPCRYC